MENFFKKNLLVLVTIIILVVFGFLAQKFGALMPVSNFTAKITIPFVYAFSKTASFFSDILKVTTTSLRIQKENKELREKNLEQIAEISRLLELEKENELLRKELNFFSQKSYQFLGAQVVLPEPTPLIDSLIINRGSKDGVKKGMAVVAGGVLIGEVKEVMSDFSKVLLLSSPQSTIGALAQNSRAKGIVIGEIEKGIILERISQDENLQIGERVITSGLGGQIPKGILIGEISEIISPKGSLFKKVILRSPVDFKKLEFVFVILK